MKTILILLLLILVGCSDLPTKRAPIGMSDPGIVVYDGCEYVYFSHGLTSIANVVHKGNCKNPTHK